MKFAKSKTTDLNLSLNLDLSPFVKLACSTAKVILGHVPSIATSLVFVRRRTFKMPLYVMPPTLKENFVIQGVAIIYIQHVLFIHSIIALNIAAINSHDKVFHIPCRIWFYHIHTT